MQNQTPALELIGLIAVEVADRKLNEFAFQETLGMIRFNSFDPDILASCFNALARSTLYRPGDFESVELRLPRTLVNPNDIENPSILTDRTPAAIRNEDNLKRLKLFANGGDDIARDTLRNVSAISEPDLLGTTEAVVSALVRKYPQLNQDTLKNQIRAMFSGFTSTMVRNLSLSIQFLLGIVDEILSGEPIAPAVNANLRLLGYPKYLSAMPKDVENEDAWKHTFKQIKEIPSNLFAGGQRPYDISLKTLSDNLVALEKEEISERARAVYRSIVAQDGDYAWSDLFDLDWEDDCLNVFVTASSVKTKTKGIAEATLDCLRQNECEILKRLLPESDETLEQYLERFGSPKKLEGEPLAEARRFYGEAGHVIATYDPKLDKRWDKLLFSQKIDGVDFLESVLNASHLLAQRVNPSKLKDPVLLLRCRSNRSKLRNVTNRNLIRYFSLLYRGLETQCRDFVEIRFRTFDFSTTAGLNPLFHFEEALEKTQSATNTRKKKGASDSKSKEALMLEFDAYLVDRADLDTDLADAKAVRISWHLPKTTISLSLARDWRLLSKKPKRPSSAYGVVFARNFRPTNTKGLVSEISLDDATSFGLTSSSFIDKNRTNLTDLKVLFQELLEEDINGIDKLSIRAAWDRFDEAYLSALADVERIGFGAPSVADMYAAYGELLRIVSVNSNKSQYFRQRALSCLLSIGVFSFIDKSSAYAVATPWQPMRLFELHREFVTNTNLIKLYTIGKANVAPSSEVLKRLHELKESLEPTFVVVPSNAGVSEDQKKLCTEILAPIQHVGGYTLYSRVAGPECRDNGMNSNAAKELANIAATSYATLVPQASNTLSLLLPDVVSKQFPQNFVNAMLEKCPDYQKLAIKVGGLNAQQYQASNEEQLYTGLTIETARSTSVEEAAIATVSLKSSVQVSVSRVRDNMLMNHPLLKEGIRPFDIAFMDRFFTYSAKNSWVQLLKRDADPDPYNLTDRLQLRSHRLVQLENEFTSTTLLCGDAVSPVGHEFINAVSWLVQDCSADHGSEFEYPCLQVNSNDLAVSEVIQNLHKLAHWVVTINDFIDRRQLINNNIKIVRYKVNPATSKTSIISSEMSTDILSSRIADRIANLGVHSLGQHARNIAKDILEASYRISGFVALRAARTSRNAHEILGLVLSNWLTQKALIEQARTQGEEVLAAVSYLVDDYASIFKNQNSLADLLCLVLALKDGKYKLHLTVTEAKFCANSGLHELQKKSARQVKATYDVLRHALNDAPEMRADRPIWLSRLADLITSLSKTDLIDTQLSSKDLILFADAVKRGDIEITLSGVSHVFAYELDKPLGIYELNASSSNETLVQFIFGKTSTANALLSFQEDVQSSDIQDVINYNLLGAIDLMKPWCFAHQLGVNSVVKDLIVTDADSEEEIEKSGQDNIPKDTIATETPHTAVESRPHVRILTLGDNKLYVQNEVTTSSTESGAVSRVVSPQTTVPAKPAVATRFQPTVPAGNVSGQINPEPEVSTVVPPVATSNLSTLLGNQTFSPYFERVVKSKASSSHFSEERMAWAQRSTRALQMVFVEKGMQAKIRSYSLTPNGCLVSFEGSASLDSKRVLALRETLLTTQAINIVLVLPQPGSLLILFNDGSDKRETVSMWNIWNRRTVEKRIAGVNLSFAVGLKETDGEILYFNPLKQDPHTLIAGRTGSGKTVLMQTLLLDMAATNPSTKLKFYIIDPKGGNDYFSLLRLPHLAEPLINDQGRAIDLLKRLVEEMYRRNQLFAKQQVNKLDRYNVKVPPEEQLPVIFLIHDELPQWMVNKEYRQTVTETLTQLATMSRATGIYLIFLAQRPDKDVMSMQIRTNLGNRLVLQLDAASSEIALEDKGAETLLGKGHLAAKLGGQLYYAQAPYLDEEMGEVDEAVDAIIEGDNEWNYLRPTQAPAQT